MSRASCRHCRENNLAPCANRAELEADAKALAFHIPDPVLLRPSCVTCPPLTDLLDFTGRHLAADL